MKTTTLSIDIGLILETSTAGQLTSNTNVFFGNDRKQKAAQVQLSAVQYIPAVGDGVLTVKATTRSSDKEYMTTLQFSKVRFVSPETQFSVPLEVPGQAISIMPLKNMGNSVEVKCTCMDFYWRFAMYNASNGSLVGEPPSPYVKKTDRAPHNPREVPGACKHITKLVSHLNSARLLK
jgi:hypothetical protein